MQEIGDWLEKLGMSEYGERFAENDIDLSVLPHLTDQTSRTSAFPSGIGGKCSRPSGNLAVRRQQHRDRLSRQQSRSRKTPPSAAKSR